MVGLQQEFVRELVFNALNGNLPEPVVRVWRSALVLAIDKGRLHKEGPFKGQTALRPVVIGTALRRIAERVPAAQLRGRWAQLFARYRQFGVAVPSGVEIAYRQTSVKGGVVPNQGLVFTKLALLVKLCTNRGDW